MTAPNQLPLSSSTPGHSKCYKTWSWINGETRGCGGSDRGWGLSQGAAESIRATSLFTKCFPTSCIPCTGSPIPSLGVNTSKPAKNQVNSSTHCHGNKEEWLQGSCQGSQVASRGMLKLARAVTCTQGLPLIRGVKHFQVLGISVILCHQLLPTGIFYVSLFYFCKGKLLLERRDSAH